MASDYESKYHIDIPKSHHLYRMITLDKYFPILTELYQELGLRLKGYIRHSNIPPNSPPTISINRAILYKPLYNTLEMLKTWLDFALPCPQCTNRECLTPSDIRDLAALASYSNEEINVRMCGEHRKLLCDYVTFMSGWGGNLYVEPKMVKKI